jgi:predicted trehalose synthase
LLVGEQSNTSIICEMSDGRPVIVKIFRALHHGANPDVTLQSAIAATGSTFVPQPIGSLTGDWDDSTQPAGVAQGHLAFAQEFLPGVQDAWRVALRAAENEDDFSSAARSLGEATAEVHESLASVFPTREPTSDDIEAIVGAMRNRLSEAVRAVPSLEQYRPAIEALFESARRADWPRLQRIHGDFHLGQVLSVPGRGWVLLDFEGEPLRPMADREEPDLPLRDIAGMLRSFDYVAGSVTLARRSESAVDWAVDARLAFVEGYSARSGRDLSGYRVLLDALEIDKALYETVYEARNRPTWVEIPVTAIRRLALGHATETATGRGSEGVRPRSSR